MELNPYSGLKVKLSQPLLLAILFLNCLLQVSYLHGCAALNCWSAPLNIFFGDMGSEGEQVGKIRCFDLLTSEM